MTEKLTKRSKGSGFIYENAESAKAAILQVDGKYALGKRLKVELKKGFIAYDHHCEDEFKISEDIDSHILGRNECKMTNIFTMGLRAWKALNLPESRQNEKYILQAILTFTFLIVT